MNTTLKYQSDPRWSRLVIIRAVGALAIILMLSYVYSWLLKLNFCLADDTWMLLTNPYVNVSHYDWHYFYNVVTRINDIQYSPLNTFYYTLIYHINGFDPYYYHLGNLFIHTANALLILILSKHILNYFEIENRNLIMYLACLIWGIHPLNVETVAWISGSKILLCTFLTLLSCIYFFKALESGNKWSFFLCGLYYLLSLFCKEQGMMTPLMYAILLYIHFVRNGIRFSLKKLPVVFVSGMLIISFLFGLFTVYVNGMVIKDFTPIAGYPVHQRGLLVFYCINFYLSNFIVPINLHYHYQYPIDPYKAVPLTFYLYPICFLCFCSFLVPLIWKSRHRLFYLFCLGVFFVQLSLELQIIPMTRPAVTADRYMYLPSLMLLLIFIHLIINHLYPRIVNSKNRQILTTCFLIYLLYLISYSHQLVGNWSLLNML
jgi:hypothetical protein